MRCYAATENMFSKDLFKDIENIHHILFKGRKASTLYTENYKTLLKEIKDINRDICAHGLGALILFRF
jgi:hypothetical protein